MKPNTKKRSAWLIAVPVLMGMAILVVLIKTRQGPEQAPPVERTTAVRVIQVPQVNLVPRVLAYGDVEPGKVWEAMAEVKGQVVDMHPRLKEGEFLAAGDVILKIDPTDYELAIAQIEGDIEATRAQLAENQVKEQNTQASLVIERESLRLSEKELKRKRDLAAKGTVPQSDVDREKRTELSQRQSVTNLESTLRLLPAERRLLEAQLARYEAKLGSARLDLARCTLVLPFDARISTVNVEQSQSVRTGDVLAVADDIRIAEVKAQVPMQRLRNAMRTRDEPLEHFPEVDPGEVLGITAVIRLPDFDLEWPARLTRLSPNIDPETRTVGVVVEVEEPYRQARPGIRPPLVKGLFVQVAFRGQPRPNSLVIPRMALHGDRVYLVGPDERLKIQPVQVGLIQPELVSIQHGLAAGDRLLVSDLVPAIEGMRLQGQPDPDTLERLVRIAEGASE